MIPVDRFREILLRHARTPKFSQAVPEASSSGHCTNPLCGDKVRVTLKIDADAVSEIGAQTAGCTMAVASASMMCELLREKSLTEAEQLRQLFSEALLDPPGASWPTAIEPLLPLSHLRENPSRVPCALMGWFAFKDAVVNARQTVE